jgi:acetyl-CoA/propionyl-CoA carboxylase biotin carboxyl carrier protein
MELDINIDGVQKKVLVEKTPDGYRFSIEGKDYAVSASKLSRGSLAFLVDGRSCVAWVSRNETGIHVSIGGNDYNVRSEEEEAGAGSHSSGHGSGTVESPMPGNIVAVNVREGEAVKAGRAVVVIESMKMQNEITAPVGGVVKKVGCAVGDQVSFGDLLVEIEPEG